MHLNPYAGRMTTTPSPLHVAVIVGSTRPGRIGRSIADWYVGEISSRDDLTIDLVDLVETDLPPTFPAETTAPLEEFRQRIDAADAFVVVTPEYNHGYPGPLKQAIDLVKPQWFAKPAGFVAYGGMAGGMRAVEQLRQVFAELHVATIRDVVGFHAVRSRFDEYGRILDVEAEAAAAAVTTMTDQLAWWAHALRTARAATPYPG